MVVRLFVGYCASVDSLEVARKIQGLFEKSGPFDYLFLFGSFDDSSLAVFRQLESRNFVFFLFLSAI